MIDLADYTKPIRDALRNGGFACVYAVASADKTRVGYSQDLPSTITRLQASSPSELSLEGALWVPDRGIATNISKAVHCDLMPNRTSGGWFNLPAPSAAQAIEIAAFRIYPSAAMVWHNELMQQCRWRAIG
ncbi:hypothetical protein [Bradyrhizobium sp. C9]|uniref:hypothetical protein n=1 Tax=Bradyrhizobium sp. C9 TaxID=142585 RepID=UPI000BE7BC55|nr:hypothetical protein [Bradyrhizobium sp. C9]PDT74132.1 hypothetical protein CO675_27055 [Bradyrhizobium sp. C9]